MRAARYPTAGVEVGRIRVESVDRPDPAPGEVLVAVVLSGVNPTDWKARQDGLPNDLGWVIPNHDGAGVVVAVGDGVSPDRIGERVWLWLAQWKRATGTAAEFVSLPTAQAVRLPESASFEIGAGLGIPAMTAHRCLFADGALDSGDHVLVQGGAGAVGHAAIQLARRAGARVAATVSSAEKAVLAEDAGAELVIDYRSEDVAERVRTWAPSGVSKIVEVDLAHNVEADTEVLAPGGVIVVYARTLEPVGVPAGLMASNARMSFVLVYTMPDEAKRSAISDISWALQDGGLHALPVFRFPLADSAAAHDAVRAGAVGKVLIDISSTE